MSCNIYTEVVVIGGGPSGYSAGFRCADLGLDTVLVEQYPNLGGVCLNVGCIPSKALLHIAKTIKDVKHLSKCGVLFNTLQIDICKIRLWKKNLIKKLSEGLTYLSNKRNIQVLTGIGSFVTANHLLVRNSQSKDFNIFFKKAVIAIGSTPVMLNNVPYLDERIWTSNDALCLSMIPKRFLIIGSGIIGLEMATIYSALGSIVDVVDTNSQIFASVDQDLVSNFLKIVSMDFKIILNTQVLKIKAKDNGIWVTLKNNSNIDKLVCYDAVLIAIGRKIDLENLNLKKIGGVSISNLGNVCVNDQLCTNIPNIYAIGDVVGYPMLAHKGIYQGKIVADIIAGKQVFFDPLVIPAIAYTNPELAWVGVTEKEAIEKNIKYKKSVFPWSVSGKAIISNAHVGQTNLIFDDVSKRIIGGAILGPNAGELLGEISLAIEMGCYAEDISLTMHAHPTLYETIGGASEVLQGISTDLINN
ncbi:dihydrolipoamide dehydrogenase [Buchnera aphidicola (Nipponaphis monzeni)]|uniref:Dihydrolipoyl dehydrogenase n=1 Tax=Buchnera aphidicola (Nipponaphis monzeni) TaxID=2495405 RepID=A0A455TA23_9GAMM|nr:dihydrolipoyl dehydrogenase [Buchnera aphidicola]BBI01182.1 dihydrolipoamide dehydrogenase [Buchnera aphidicola (Nipponaphis monzeni)]